MIRRHPPVRACRVPDVDPSPPACIPPSAKRRCTRIHFKVRGASHLWMHLRLRPLAPGHRATPTTHVTDQSTTLSASSSTASRRAGRRCGSLRRDTVASVQCINGNTTCRNWHYHNLGREAPTAARQPLIGQSAQSLICCTTMTIQWHNTCRQNLPVDVQCQ
jgi:hypothetical protein